jgi:hypothetical protein
MNRRILKRVLITFGITAGVLATAGHASALGALNHSESTLRSR